MKSSLLAAAYDKPIPLFLYIAAMEVIILLPFGKENPYRLLKVNLKWKEKRKTFKITSWGTSTNEQLLFKKK